MSGMWVAVTAAIALLVFWLFFTQRQRLRESEQIRDALVSAVHECRAEIARLRLTDAEREAVRWVCGDVADITGPVEGTLRGLLERL